MTGDGLTPTLEHLLRDLAPQVLGAVTRRHGDLSDAEDAVQEALIAAAAQWPSSGIPDNPRGWLYQVALRRYADQARSNTARRRREGESVAEAVPHVSSTPYVDALVIDDDDTLVLLFMCCHPAITSSSAVALTLRAVGGLTTAEIARAFLVPEATMAQRISRAKQSIAASSVPFALPSAAERTPRLSVVLRVLYLIFNEGYASSAGAELLRVDLASEAIRITRGLRSLLPEDPEVVGLHALMLLTHARRAARTGPHGELIPLDEQDRTRWDRDAIAEGVALVTLALSLGHIGPYQVQAAIAAIHSEAANVGETDWPQILAFYDLLLRMHDNPMIRLNRAIAVAMVHGAERGLYELEALVADPRLTQHHRVDAVRAHLHERMGNIAAAIAGFRTAAARTASLAERHYLLTKAAKLTYQCQ